MASAPTSETATTTPTEAGDRTGRRGPGRPPDLEKRQAIIDATLDVLAEVGYASLTIDAVAKRAGSNRVLIYRVWDSKVLLVRDALFGLAANLTLPDTGSTREDLRDFVRQHVDHMRLPAYVNGVPGLTVELLSNRELFRDTWQQFIKPTEDGFATLLARGRARGDVVRDVEPWVLTRVVSGITTGLAQTSRVSAEEITDVVMDAVLGGLIELDED
jgi:AcrR family transcriptional regulator